jgi:hypothetical protein
MMKTLLTAAAFVVALTGMASAEANSKFSPGAYEACSELAEYVNPKGQQKWERCLKEKTMAECVVESTTEGYNLDYAKKVCNPDNFVTNPNEWGWVCNLNKLFRTKGAGVKDRHNLICDL